jgi:hypothetical protein
MVLDHKKSGGAVVEGEIADDGHLKELNKMGARVSVDLVNSRSDIELIR